MDQACCVAEVDLAAHVTQAVRIVQGRPTDMAHGPLQTHRTHTLQFNYNYDVVHGSCCNER